MTERRWRFGEIDALERPAPRSDRRFTEEEREAARAELRRRPAGQEERNRAVREAYPAFGERWRAIRRVLGVTAFGVSANAADAGEPPLIPHDESEHGHEELYVVLRGRARIEAGGEVHEGGAGAFLFTRPGVFRSATAVEDDTLLLMIGGEPGTYEPPIWAADWRKPQSWLEARRET